MDAITVLPQSEPQPTASPDEQQARKGNSREVIKAKLLGGNIVAIRRGKILGYCHNLSHPGKVTKSILDKHQCLAKQCPFLERYEEAPFWVQRKARKLAKHKARENKKERKAVLHAETASMTELRLDFQRRADAAEAEIEVIRVEQPNVSSYTVYYVSDNRFSDWDQFPEFLHAIRAGRPWVRVTLRHIKDVDGHFVTRQEYHARRR